jgi:hypothetical protein
MPHRYTFCNLPGVAVIAESSLQLLSQLDEVLESVRAIRIYQAFKDLPKPRRAPFVPLHRQAVILRREIHQSLRRLMSDLREADVSQWNVESPLYLYHLLETPTLRDRVLAHGADALSLACRARALLSGFALRFADVRPLLPSVPESYPHLKRSPAGTSTSDEASSQSETFNGIKKRSNDGAEMAREICSQLEAELRRTEAWSAT